MGDVVRFPPPSESGGGGAARPISLVALRMELEAAARDALDTADRIIAALDRFDGDPTEVVPAALTDPVVWFPEPRSDATIPPERS